MARSKKSNKGKFDMKQVWGWICTTSKSLYEKCKVGAKRTLEWFRAHPIVSHILAIVLVLMCLVIIVYVVMALGTRHNAQRTVPNFVGLTIDDASHFASRRDLEIVVNDSLYVPSCAGGVVLEQLPTEGVIVKPGRKIYVTINSLNQRKAVVPYVAELSLRQAKTRLEAAGFVIEHLEYVEDPATNYVLAEFVNGEEITETNKLEAYVGSGVWLRVGVAPDAKSVPMPNLLGLSLGDAKSRLWAAGLNVGALSFDKGITIQERDLTKVYYQSRNTNAEAQRGDTVLLALTLSQEKVSLSIEADEKRIAEEIRAKFVADSIAQVELRLRDSIANANRELLNDPQTAIQIVHTDEIPF